MIRLASAALAASLLLAAAPVRAEDFDAKAWEAAARKETATLKPKVHDCQEKALADGRDASGTLTVTWVVFRDGRVMQARVERSTVKDEALETCVVDAVRGLRFPPRGDSVATVPMTQSWTLGTKKVAPEKKQE